MPIKRTARWQEIEHSKHSNPFEIAISRGIYCVSSCEMRIKDLLVIRVRVIKTDKSMVGVGCMKLACPNWFEIFKRKMWIFKGYLFVFFNYHRHMFYQNFIGFPRIKLQLYLHDHQSNFPVSDFECLFWVHQIPQTKCNPWNEEMNSQHDSLNSRGNCGSVVIIKKFN